VRGHARGQILSVVGAGSHEAVRTLGAHHFRHGASHGISAVLCGPGQDDRLRGATVSEGLGSLGGIRTRENRNAIAACGARGSEGLKGSAAGVAAGVFNKNNEGGHGDEGGARGPGPRCGGRRSVRGQLRRRFRRCAPRGERAER
jgi:hypothetical protein